MANTRFQLEGNAPQVYERDIVPTMFRPTAELMFEQVSLHAGERVLDIACGTGIVTRVAVQRFPHIASIVGMDLNPGILAVARENTPTTSVPVEWRQGDMCALPFPDRRFDVALCQQGLQFVPHKFAALSEIRRVLVPGGRFVFSVQGEVPAYQAKLSEALARHVNAEAAASCLAPFAWRDAETIRQLVDEAGFHAVAMHMMAFMRPIRASVDAVLESMAHSPYAREVAAVTEEVRQAIGQEVVDALQPYRESDNFVIPQKIHLVQAQVP